jgi:hypothetical protein
MALLIGTATALSTGANIKTANLIVGSYSITGKGRITVVAKGSATGMYITVLMGGINLVNDQAIPFTGTAGTLSTRDNVIIDQVVSGGIAELYLTNKTGGALTTDYLVYFDPMK